LISFQSSENDRNAPPAIELDRQWASVCCLSFSGSGCGGGGDLNQASGLRLANSEPLLGVEEIGFSPPTPLLISIVM
jgi:hypothetical protein